MQRPWAVVLGVSSGFGAATAKALASRGYAILGVHLDLRSTLHRVQAVREHFTETGVPHILVNANAADASKRDDALDGWQDAYPDARVTLLFHSLAFGSLKPFVGHDQERIAPRNMSMTLDVMAHSLVYWVQALLDRDRLASGARIFAMTSSGSLAALPDYGAVSAAKAALEAHVRQLAVELAPKGITVNAIMAGVTRTPALERIPTWKALEAAALARNPHGRLTVPEDVARCILALSSADTAWMTGNVIRVDGGETIAV